MRDVFRRIFASNAWRGAESRSGEGSDLAQTGVIRREIPGLLRRLGAASLLDAPCGDFNWMRHVDLAGVDYVGGDIVPDIVAANRARFGGPGRRFEVLDITADSLPRADVMLCRDCLVHLSFADIRRALRNIRASGTTWLLATTFPGRANAEIETGQWRPLDLCAAPLGFPPPAELLNEGCTEWDGHWADKSLGLWRVSEVPAG